MVKLIGLQRRPVVDHHAVLEIDTPAGGPGDVRVEPGSLTRHMKIPVMINNAELFRIILSGSAAGSKAEAFRFAEQRHDHVQVMDMQVIGQQP